MKKSWFVILTLKNCPLHIFKVLSIFYYDKKSFVYNTFEWHKLENKIIFFLIWFLFLFIYVLMYLDHLDGSSIWSWIRDQDKAQVPWRVGQIREKAPWGAWKGDLTESHQGLAQVLCFCFILNYLRSCLQSKHCLPDAGFFHNLKPI